MDNENNSQGSVLPLQPTKPQSVQSQPIQPVQPAQPVQPQPVEPQQERTIGQLESAEPKEQKRFNGTMILTIIAVTVLAIIGIVIAIFLSGGNGGGSEGGSNDGSNNVSFESVKRYCEKADLSVREEEYSDSEHSGKYLECSNDDKENPIYSVFFVIYDKPIMEYEDFSLDSKQNLISNGSILAESDNYLKVALSPPTGGGVIYYLIIDGKTYLELTALGNDVAKEALIQMGYADKDWLTDEQSQGSGNSSFIPTLQSTQRDTERRSDLAYISTLLIQYQTNNRGNLPIGPSYWKGALEISCEVTNTACYFIKDYMNDGDSSVTITNQFTDPDGTPYSLYITENWVDNGSITPNFGNANSYLAVNGDGYTIGGASPFMERIIYVIPGGRCNEDGSGAIVKGDSSRSYAVMFMLESKGLYCTEGL